MADILIGMNKTTDKLWKYADEWEKTPEHFDGVNPFCVAIHAVRQMTNAPELLNEQKHGHWKGFTQSRYFGMDDDGEPIFRDGVFYVCSECRRKSIIKYPYCPTCGAKMNVEAKQDG